MGEAFNPKRLPLHHNLRCGAHHALVLDAHAMLDIEGRNAARHNTRKSSTFNTRCVLPMYCASSAITCATPGNDASANLIACEHAFACPRPSPPSLATNLLVGFDAHTPSVFCCQHDLARHAMPHATCNDYDSSTNPPLARAHVARVAALPRRSASTSNDVVGPLPRRRTRRNTTPSSEFQRSPSTSGASKRSKSANTTSPHTSVAHRGNFISARRRLGVNIDLTQPKGAQAVVAWLCSGLCESDLPPSVPNVWRVLSQTIHHERGVQAQTQSHANNICMPGETTPLRGLDDK